MPCAQRIAPATRCVPLGLRRLAPAINGLLVTQLCCLFCCPPCPCRIATKLAFLPPGPTYSLVPEPEPGLGGPGPPPREPAVLGRQPPGTLEAPPAGARRLLVQPAQAGQHRGLGDQEQPGQRRLLHVRALRAQRRVHGCLLAGQRGGPGPDEQFLHRPGHVHQLQHLQLLRLRRELGQALGVEPLCRQRPGRPCASGTASARTAPSCTGRASSARWPPWTWPCATSAPWWCCPSRSPRACSSPSPTPRRPAAVTRSPTPRRCPKTLCVFIPVLPLGSSQPFCFCFFV